MTQQPREEDVVAYVLGTDDSSERAVLARATAADPAVAAQVSSWEDRLAPLAAVLPEIAPGPGLLDRIEQAIDRVTDDSLDLSTVILLRRSRNFWRGATGGMAALAAALAIGVLLPVFQSPPRSGVLVAAVNRTGDLPALIVRVDPARHVVQVRALATNAPDGRSLQLWSIAGGGAPRSLGLVSGPAMTLAADTGSTPLAQGVTLAVSSEPKGGSPTGLPTGPVVYKGELVAEQP